MMRRATRKKKMVGPPDFSIWYLMTKTKLGRVLRVPMLDSLGGAGATTSSPGPKIRTRSLRTEPNEKVARTMRATMEIRAKYDGMSSGWAHRLRQTGREIYV